VPSFTDLHIEFLFAVLDRFVVGGRLAPIGWGRSPSEFFFAPSPLLGVRSWLHPFKGHSEQKASEMRGLFVSLVINY